MLTSYHAELRLDVYHVYLGGVLWGDDLNGELGCAFRGGVWIGPGWFGLGWDFL